MKKPSAQQPPTDAPDARRNFLRLAFGAGTGAVLGGSLLAACGGGGDASTAGGREQPMALGDICVPVAFTVVSPADGSTVATMTVSNTGTNLSLDFAAPAGCAITQVFAWVGSDVTTIPLNAFGNANLGAFPHRIDVVPANAAVNLTLPLSGISLPPDPCQGPLYIMVKVFTTCSYGFLSSSTTYGGLGYVSYRLCGLDCTVLEGCETAFAKGTHVFVTDSKANPEGLPSIGLTRNRWGWAIRRTSTGTTTHNVYAGAGLNNISRATLVGTVTIDWNGSTAIVTYTLAAGVVMTEAHLYAGTAAPTTLAPGQYGNTATFLSPVTSHTFTVPVSGSTAWFIVHGVVC